MILNLFNVIGHTYATGAGFAATYPTQPEDDPGSRYEIFCLTA